MKYCIYTQHIYHFSNKTNKNITKRRVCLKVKKTSNLHILDFGESFNGQSLYGSGPNNLCIREVLWPEKLPKKKDDDV